MRYFLALLSLCSMSSIALAQTNSQLTLARWNEGAFGETNDRPLYQSQAHLKNEAANAQVFWWDSYGRFRFDKTNPNPPLTIGYRWATMTFDTNSAVIPQHLDDISMAAAIRINENISLIAGAGYTSDSPFADANGIYGIGHLIYQRPLDQTNSLSLSIDYNGNSSLFPDVPLPGIQYVHREQPFSYGIGFPDDFVTWEITPNFRFDATYSVPFTTFAQLEYRLNQHVSFFVDGANFFNGFELRDAPTTDRLFYQMSRAEGGVRYRATIYGNYLDIALAVGYAFDQNFDRGFDARELNHIASISDVPYVGIVIIGRL